MDLCVFFFNQINYVTICNYASAIVWQTGSAEICLKVEVHTNYSFKLNPISALHRCANEQKKNSWCCIYLIIGLFSGLVTPRRSRCVYPFSLMAHSLLGAKCQQESVRIATERDHNTGSYACRCSLPILSFASSVFCFCCHHNGAGTSDAATRCDGNLEVYCTQEINACGLHKPTSNMEPAIINYYNLVFVCQTGHRGRY